MEDKSLTCRDCGREFSFTASEQEFFAQKGFTNEPGRCPECRAARKVRTDGGSSYGGSSYGGSGGSSSYNRTERQMYPAVCAQCGKETQVPFQPRDERPVYCSDCFATKRQSSGGYERGGSSSRGGYGGGSSRGGGGSRW